MTLTELEVVSLEDLDFEIPCSLSGHERVVGQPLPARWVMINDFPCRNKPRPSTSLLCDPCKVRLATTDWLACMCECRCADPVIPYRDAIVSMVPFTQP